MSDGEDVLRARDVAFAYRPGEPVLAGVSLSAAGGRLVCVLGPNGSGKTTLLRCVMGALRPTGGEVLLAGRAVGDYSHRELARLLAYVPQFPTSAFAFSALNGSTATSAEASHSTCTSMRRSSQGQLAAGTRRVSSAAVISIHCPAR